MPSFLRAITSRVLVAVPAWQWALGLAAGVFFALIGALGSDRAPLLPRLAFWVPLLLLGMLCGGFIDEATMGRRFVRTHVLIRWSVLTLAITTPMILAAWLLARLLFGAANASLENIAWATTVISGAMTALMLFVNKPGEETVAAPAQAGPAAFLARLPPPLRQAKVWAVSAEDHYLRVHTSAGETLILMRLADALRELQGIAGAQVHRSWWVAREAVIGVRQEGRKRVLVVGATLAVPISRPNVRALEEMGWFAV